MERSRSEEQTRAGGQRCVGLSLRRHRRIKIKRRVGFTNIVNNNSVDKDSIRNFSKIKYHSIALRIGILFCSPFYQMINLSISISNDNNCMFRLWMHCSLRLQLLFAMLNVDIIHLMDYVPNFYFNTFQLRLVLPLVLILITALLHVISHYLYCH